MGSKTNRAGRELGAQKKHFCPSCDEVVTKLHRQMPGGKMRGRCGNGHEYPKASLILK